MNHKKKIPAIKVISVSFSISILLGMSIIAEAAGPHQDHKPSSRDEGRMGIVQQAGQSNSRIISDGEVILGETYTAEGVDESVLEASGTVEASVTRAVLQKLSGGASSADASSFQQQQLFWSHPWRRQGICDDGRWKHLDFDH